MRHKPPRTREIAAGLELSGEGWLPRLIGFDRHETDLIESVDVGAPLSAYTVRYRPDPGGDVRAAGRSATALFWWTPGSADRMISKRMSEQPSLPDIVLVAERLERAELQRLVAAHFEDMVKYVVDVARGVAAVGGELHADEEAVLLDDGSRQEDLWGANYYPGRGEAGCIEYTALINIRPSHGNRSMLIEDEDVRARVREITFALIGRGESLA